MVREREKMEWLSISITINRGSSGGRLVHSTRVFEPNKVVHDALQNAASMASLLITTEAMVAEKPRQEAPMPPMGGVGMEGMY